MIVFQSEILNKDKKRWLFFSTLTLGIFIFVATGGLKGFIFIFIFYSIIIGAYVWHVLISFKKIELTNDKIIVNWPLINSEQLVINQSDIYDIVLRVKMSRGYTYYYLHIVWTNEQKTESNKEFLLGLTNEKSIQGLIDNLRNNQIDIPIINEAYGEELKIN